jgi:hypothetical protein
MRFQVAGSLTFRTGVFVLSALLLLTSAGLARDLHVGSGQQYTTIQSAALAAVAGDNVIVHAGTYCETVTPANSGTSSAPITFKKYGSDEVTISAADKITNWTLDAGTIYYASVNWDMGAGMNQVFVEKEMMIDARYPNITDENGIMEVLTSNKTFTSTAYSDRVESSSLTQAADFWKGGVYWGRHGDAWAAQCATISSSASGVINVTNKNGSWWWCSGCSDFYGDLNGAGSGFISGVRGALDQQREFFHDAAAGRLYLWAPGNQNPNNLNVYAKRRVSVLVLSDKSYITIDGLNGLGGGIDMDGSVHCTVKNGQYKGMCHFLRFNDANASNILGTGADDPAATGIFVSGTGNTLENLDLSFSAGPIIRLDGFENTVTNSTIHDAGYAGTYGSGIFICRSKPYNNQAGRHHIDHLTISRVGRAAVQWQSGSGSYLGSFVEYNDISDYLMLAADGGALYGYEVDFGTDVRTEWAYNWIHDSRGMRYCSAIYSDNYCSNLLMHHNVIWNGDAAVQVNGGDNAIDVFNNTFWNCAAVMPDPYGGTLTNVRMYNNLAANCQSTAFKGTDMKNNLVTNSPGFVSTSKPDFSLQSGSPAINYGIAIAGITDGSVGAPDAGAYEFGGTAWTAGPVAVPPTPTRESKPATTMPGPAISIRRGALTVASPRSTAIVVNVMDAQGRLIAGARGSAGTCTIERSSWGHALRIIRIIQKGNTWSRLAPQ